MGFFTRKSKWDHIREAMIAAAKDRADLRKMSKVTLGVAAGAVAVTAASAAISAVREQQGS